MSEGKKDARMKEYRTKAVKTIKALRAKIDAQAAELKAAKSILESKDLVAKQAAELGATSGGGDNDAAHLAEKARLDQRVEDLTKQVMVLSEVADVTDIEEELARVQAECAVQTERALKYKTKSRALKEQLAGERAKQSSGASPAEMEAHATVKMELGALKQKLARAQNSAAEVEPLRLALREKSDAAESSAEALRAAMSAERRAKATAIVAEGKVRAAALKAAEAERRALANPKSDSKLKKSFIWGKDDDRKPFRSARLERKKFAARWTRRSSEW